jgi:iron uptake system EfeUOB component EfeO/EfeM
LKEHEQMNIKYTIITAVLAGTLGLAGCGTTGNGTANDTTNTTNQTSQTTQTTSHGEQDASLIQTGVDRMLDIAAQLKTAATKEDVKTVKATGPKLEDEWRTFEDHVKPKYPDLYAQVEQYLDPTIAASQAAQFNKQALTQLDSKLMEALQSLKAKVKGKS